MNLLDINKDVEFKDFDHTYCKNKVKLTSVTKILGFYKNPFDPNGHIIRACAKRDGVSVEQIREQWNKTKEEGLVRGKNFHRQAEHFIKTGQILEEDYKDIIQQFAEFKFKGKLFSEIGLHSDKYSIAGTCDLIELFDDNSFITFDFKSNKRFTIKSKYNKFLLHPLEHLPECDLTTYSLQLWIYNLMLEEHGYKIKKGSTILYINPEIRKIDKYPILNLKKEAKSLLKHFKEMNEW